MQCNLSLGPALNDKGPRTLYLQSERSLFESDEEDDDEESKSSPTKSKWKKCVSDVQVMPDQTSHSCIRLLDPRRKACQTKEAQWQCRYRNATRGANDKKLGGEFEDLPAQTQPCQAA